ncbi:hypothetical protein O181_025106 [Austropuccinia psidii MF-1]|uniref:Uncharacterized protein n=1 Tax=Austropuccinia psidii MF-1 TaxID=1389203 RepID=A0A9Q3CMR9_9BASI|nr:hypothetical protein [Austropuccinia psidii MF-1]
MGPSAIAHHRRGDAPRQPSSLGIYNTIPSGKAHLTIIKVRLILRFFAHSQNHSIKLPMFSLRASILPVLFLSLTLFQLSLCATQTIQITSPQENQVIKPNDKIQVVLKKVATTTADLSFSIGFQANAPKDSTSLGRPYVLTKIVGRDIKLNADQSTYSFELSVPQASDFLDGFSANYTFTVSHYHLSGSTNTPTIYLASTPVKVQNS